MPEHPAVGGLGMLFGVVITLFYLGADLAGAKALLAAGAVLAAAGAWWGRSLPASRHGGSLFEIGAGAAAVYAVFLLAPFPTNPWTGPGPLLMLLLLATPGAVSFLLRSSAAPTDLPIGVVLIQLVLLLLLVALGLERGLVAALLSDVQTVALPVIGALLGALLYICPMPWRNTAAISTGVATCLCLGLVVAWTAARIGFAEFPEGRDSTAFLPWILAVPVFEWLRRHAALLFVRASQANGMPDHRHEPGASYPTWLLYAFTLVLGSIGIALWLSNSPASWSAWGLLPAWLVYCMPPLFLRPLRSRPTSRVADA